MVDKIGSDFVRGVSPENDLRMRPCMLATARLIQFFDFAMSYLSGNGTSDDFVAGEPLCLYYFTSLVQPHPPRDEYGASKEQSISRWVQL